MGESFLRGLHWILAAVRRVLRHDICIDRSLPLLDTFFSIFLRGAGVVSHHNWGNGETCLDQAARLDKESIHFANARRTRCTRTGESEPIVMSIDRSVQSYMRFLQE